MTDLFAGRLSLIGTENAFKVGEDIKRVEERGDTVIKLNLGEPDFDSPVNINDVAIANITKGNSHYTDPQGLPSFRESIGRHLEETRGSAIDPDCIVVTSGGKPPIGYSLLSYVNPGDEVIYPTPGFPIYESWIKFSRGTPKPFKLRESKKFSFDLEDVAGLISRKTKLFILNSPSNPTGGIVSREELDALAALLLDKAHPDFRIMSDEVYDHILFDGHKHQSIISSPGMQEHTILINSHSKTYAMTGWRVGYAVLPSREEAQVFKRWNINTYSCTPPFIQMAAQQALDDEVNRTIVADMVAEFERRRNVIVKAINEIDGFHCIWPSGAFYAFPNIAKACEKLGIIEFCRNRASSDSTFPAPSTVFQLFALYHHGVATLDRGAFGTIGSEGQHFIRVSLASDLDTLQAGVDGLEAAASDEEGARDFMLNTLPSLLG